MKFFLITFDKELCKDTYNIKNNIYRIELKNFKLSYRINNNSRLRKILNKVIEINNKEYKEEIEKIISLINPDIIHCNNFYGASPELWNILSKSKIPIVQTIHDYWNICPRSTLIKSNNKVCKECKLICKFYRKYFDKKSKYVSKFIFPSKFMKAEFDNINMYKNKTLTINNFLDIDYEKVKDIINLKKQRVNSKIKYAYVGRLEKIKGIDLIINEFNKLKDFDYELHICGDGSLKDLIINNESEKIIYHGKVDEKTRDSILMDCDILIVPSLWNEPFGLVAIEGMRFGCIPILSNKGALREIAFDEEFQLFDIEDECSLRKKIISINRKNIKLQLDNIIKKISSYDSNERINDYINLYKEVIGDSN